MCPFLWIVNNTPPPLDFCILYLFLVLMSFKILFLVKVQKWNQYRPEDEKSNLETSEPHGFHSLYTDVHGTMFGSVSSSAASRIKERGSGARESFFEASKN